MGDGEEDVGKIRERYVDEDLEGDVDGDAEGN